MRKRTQTLEDQLLQSQVPVDRNSVLEESQARALRTGQLSRSPSLLVSPGSCSPVDSPRVSAASPQFRFLERASSRQTRSASPSHVRSVSPGAQARDACTQSKQRAQLVPYAHQCLDMCAGEDDGMIVVSPSATAQAEAACESESSLWAPRRSLGDAEASEDSATMGHGARGSALDCVFPEVAPSRSTSVCLIRETSQAGMRGRGEAFQRHPKPDQSPTRRPHSAARLGRDTQRAWASATRVTPVHAATISDMRRARTALTGSTHVRSCSPEYRRGPQEGVREENSDAVMEGRGHMRPCDKDNVRGNEGAWQPREGARVRSAESPLASKSEGRAGRARALSRRPHSAMLRLQQKPLAALRSRLQPRPAWV